MASVTIMFREVEKRLGEQKPFGLGVVGLGRGFVLTLPALKAHPLVALRGAFDLRLDASQGFASAFQATPYESLADLLADPEIDAVYIATPHELHVEHAVLALDAGKHVLLEKPMAISVSECRKIELAALQSGKQLVVGPSHAFDPSVKHASELIHSGRLGKLQMVTALNFTDFMYRPRLPAELNTQLGGGVVYSQAAHQIDVVRSLVGQPVVSIRGATLQCGDGMLTEGAYTALLTFHGGAVAAMTYSGQAHFDSDELVGWISELGHRKDPNTYGAARQGLRGLTPKAQAAAKVERSFRPGSNSAAQPEALHNEHFGFIVASCERGDIKLLPDSLVVFGDEAREVIEFDPFQSTRLNAIDELVNAITRKAKAIHDARWGLDTIACCEALLQSSKCGRDVDPREIIRKAEEDPIRCRN